MAVGFPSAFDNDGGEPIFLSFAPPKTGGGDAMGYVTPEQLYALITLLIAVAGFSATATLTVIRIVMFIINQNNKKK